MPKSREPRKVKKKRKKTKAIPNPRTKPWFSLDGGAYSTEHPFDPNDKPPNE